MHFDYGTSRTLSTDVMIGLARYRQRVSVEKLGWPLKTPEHGLELDQFDREDTVYIIGRNEIGDIVGAARLLPTSKPYLLGEVFPQLMHGKPLPSTPAVWELSRFAAADFNPAQTDPMSRMPPVAADMLCRTIYLAADLGAERLITVSTLGVERLLSRSRFLPHRAAPPVIIDGQPLFACWIELNLELRPLH